MKKFLYIRRQSGGCDYTIGCGVDIQVIKASSREAAIKEIIGFLDSWKEDFKAAHQEDNLEGYFHDCLLESGLRDARDDKYREHMADTAHLYEIVSETDVMPILKSFLKEVSDFKDQLLEDAKEKAERAQYEQLKKKFEKK